MKVLRWLVIVPLLGLDQCPADQSVLFFEVEGTLEIRSA